jgi:SAM-dependent methyltransferase
VAEPSEETSEAAWAPAHDPAAAAAAAAAREPAAAEAQVVAAAVDPEVARAGLDPEAAAREAWLRRWHAARPGSTSAALARGGTYERLAALVPPGARVLDLGAGDGYLCELLAARGARPVGVDVSREELALLRRRAGGSLCGVAARAQALPFVAGAFDACVCHLAFMLMEDAPAVARELARVLAPGGWFAAVLGGGPVIEPAGGAGASPAGGAAGGAAGDAFHRFLALAGSRFRAPGLGDPRARSERGWRELLPGWEIAFERWEVDLAGTFDEVWRFLGASYQLPREDAAAVRAELAAAVADLTDADGRVPCRMVTWLATARRRC